MGVNLDNIKKLNVSEAIEYIDNNLFNHIDINNESYLNAKENIQINRLVNIITAILKIKEPEHVFIIIKMLLHNNSCPKLKDLISIVPLVVKDFKISIQITNDLISFLSSKKLDSLHGHCIDFIIKSEQHEDEQLLNIALSMMAKNKEALSNITLSGDYLNNNSLSYSCSRDGNLEFSSCSDYKVFKTNIRYENFKKLASDNIEILCESLLYLDVEDEVLMDYVSNLFNEEQLLYLGE